MGLAEDAARDAINELLMDIEWRDYLTDVMVGMNVGQYPKRYMDIIVQKPDDPTYNIYDAFCFSWVDNALKNGTLGLTAIDAGDVPFPDTEVVAMNELLKYIPSPYYANFEPRYGAGGPHDDGDLYWDKPIHAVVLLAEKRAGLTLIPPRLIGRDTSPFLEVGTVSAEKTFWWLHGMDGNTGLARWPYGSRYIYLFHQSASFVYNNDPNFDDMLASTPETMLLLPRVWDIINEGFVPYAVTNTGAALGYEEEYCEDEPEEVCEPFEFAPLQEPSGTVVNFWDQIKVKHVA